MREHIAERRAVLLAEAVDDVHAALQLVEARGAELDALAVVAQLVRGLLQGDVGLLDHLLGIRERIVEAADVLEVLLDLREGGQDAEAAAAAPLEELVRLLDGADDLLGVRELADLRLERFVLARLEVGLGDLLVLPVQHVEALRVLARGLLLLGVGLLLLAPLAVGALIGGQRLGDVGVVAVEQMELVLLLEEREVLVLPVDIDEVGADLAQDGQRDVAAVDERRAAARPRELPRDDELLVRVVDGLLRQKLVQAERLVLE